MNSETTSFKINLESIRRDNVNDLECLNMLYELADNARMDVEEKLDTALITMAKRNARYLSIIPWYISKDLETKKCIDLLIDENSNCMINGVRNDVEPIQKENIAIRRLLKFYEHLDILKIHPAYIPAISFKEEDIEKIMTNNELVKYLFILFLGIEQRPIYDIGFFDFISVLDRKVSDPYNMNNYISYILNEINKGLSRNGFDSLCVHVNYMLVHTYVELKLHSIRFMPYHTDIINTDFDIFYYLEHKKTQHHCSQFEHEIIKMLKNPRFGIIESIKPFNCTLKDINGDVFDEKELLTHQIYVLHLPQQPTLEDLREKLKDTINTELKLRILATAYA